MSKAKELLASIAALFKAAESPEKFVEAKLADGTLISCDKLEVGGMVTIGGTPAPEGEHVMEDGSCIVVDATGAITEVKPKPAEPGEVDMNTPEGMRKAYDKFAVGTPEERLANAEVLLKALMEYSFGWQLREAEEKANREKAMNVYTNTLKTTEATVTQQSEMMKQMFALMEEIVGAPAGYAPPPSRKKFSFSNVEVKNKSLEKFQAAAKKLSDEFAEKQKKILEERGIVNN